jgi:predicted nucleic acid-binding protein
MMAPSTPAYMLDTNVFNDIHSGKIPLALFAGKRLLVTGIQEDELRNTKNAEKRDRLLAAFERVGPVVTLCASFALDIEGAGWGQAYWNDGTGNFEKMRDRLCALDAPKKRHTHLSEEELQLNQERDILIAETAIKEGAVLVTGDKNLRQVIVEFGGSAVDLAQFISRSVY